MFQLEQGLVRTLEEKNCKVEKGSLKI